MEVRAQVQRALLDGRPLAPKRSERRAVTGERLALDKLVVERLFGPARQPTHIDEGLILARTGGRLPSDDDAFDARLIGGEFEPLHPVEELESDAAPPKHLVQGREDGLAHARAHLVEDGTAVAREHAQHSENGESRASPGTVAEGEVVEGADQPARYHAFGGPVLAEPIAVLHLVERLEVGAGPMEAVAQNANHGDRAELEDDPHPAQVGVGLEVASGQGPEPIEQRREAVGEFSCRDATGLGASR
ncbi:hypothetical protein [Stigmatella aurantiaca]|uniref:hypothetical protein n=1 Tax=Stigmatella aurantiaca TaxID=41 RepID=UPI0012FBFD86|nr:hypothetical protein [Stigmatella aurantiaca]